MDSGQLRSQNTHRFLKIYTWQAVSLILRFLSMFIVTPALSKHPSIFGIYMVCISVTIFLNYADLGFFRAAQKYATDFFIKGEKRKEIDVIGFSLFVSLGFAFLMSLGMIFLSFYPEFLVKDFKTSVESSTASQLLLILALFAPVNIIQKFVGMIFTIRLEDYRFQRILCIANLVAIASAFYFFRTDRYEIVEYFLLAQVANFIATLVSVFLIKNSYDIDFIFLLKRVRYDHRTFLSMKKLAFSTLYISLVWVLYYELDQVSIGKLLGTDQVAIYAIGFTFATLMRSIFGILFSPFGVRINQLNAEGDLKKLKIYCSDLLACSAPLVLIPVSGFVLIAESFILSWVGPSYSGSVPIAKFLAGVYAFSFLSYPISMLIMAREEIRNMFLISTVQPLIYWGGIFLSFDRLGVLSFAICKFISAIVSEIFYLKTYLSFENISLFGFLKKYIFHLVVPLSFMFVSISWANDFLPMDKSKWNLLIVGIYISLIIGMAFLIQYLVSPQIRRVVKEIFGQLFNRNIV